MNENLIAQENDAALLVKESATTVVSSDVATLLLANIDKLNTAQAGIQLDSEYFEFKTVGQKTRGVFAGIVKCKFKVDGFDPANPEYDEQDAVKWVNKDEKGTIKSFICSSVALVNKIKDNAIATGTGLEIELTDDKGGNNKKTKLFNVTMLDLSK